MHEKDGSIHSPSSSTFCATRLWNRRQGIRNRTPVMLMWWLFVGLVHILLISDGRCTTGAIKIPPFKSTTGVRSIGTTTTSSTPYRLGNFVYRDNRDNNTTTRQQEPRPSTMVGHKSILESLLWNKQNILRQLLERYGGTIQRVFHLLVFGFYTKNSILSILEDQWEAERNPEKVFSQRGIWYQGERKVVKRRTVQASVMRKYVGVGYTPRIVWLYGVMLRGIINCTAIRKIFNPHLGWGAGSVMVAKFAHREWIPCIMVGFFVGTDWYWKILFGVKGTTPPTGDDTAFDGVPITINGVRF